MRRTWIHIPNFIFIMTTLLPKPRRKTEKLSDDFIRKFQENKQYEMRLKTRLMEEFYDVISEVNSTSDIKYVISSFWTVVNNVFPTEEIQSCSEVKILDEEV